jgi:acetyltransferase-like isoleucine patch superfamily enzyme
MLGANTTITDTDSHPLDFQKRSPDFYGEPLEAAVTEVATAPIIIGEDVFIGMHTLILKGVTIGRGTVVGAGSVVSKSLPEHCIAAGNPAKPLRYINPPSTVCQVIE